MIELVLCCELNYPGSLVEVTKIDVDIVAKRKWGTRDDFRWFDIEF